MTLRQALTEKFPDALEDEILKVITGYYLFCCLRHILVDRFFFFLFFLFLKFSFCNVLEQSSDRISDLKRILNFLSCET